MAKAPAFQLYAADFYMDTGSWTAVQVGIYFRLLMSDGVFYWRKNMSRKIIIGYTHKDWFDDFGFLEVAGSLYFPTIYRESGGYKNRRTKVKITIETIDRAIKEK